MSFKRFFVAGSNTYDSAADLLRCQKLYPDKKNFTCRKDTVKIVYPNGEFKVLLNNSSNDSRHTKNDRLYHLLTMRGLGGKTQFGHIGRSALQLETPYGMKEGQPGGIQMAPRNKF